MSTNLKFSLRFGEPKLNPRCVANIECSSIAGHMYYMPMENQIQTIQFRDVILKSLGTVVIEAGDDLFWIIVICNVL